MSPQELTSKYQQTVHEARVARDATTELLAKFKQAEKKAEMEESKFASINREIAELDKEYEAEELPTDKETYEYGQRRLALLAKRDTQLQAMQNARQFREQLRMEALRSDQLYARLEQERQNLRSVLEGKLGQVAGGVYYVA